MEHAVVFGLSKEAVLAAITGLFAGMALLMFVRGMAHGSSRPYIWAWLVRMGICLVAFISQLAGGATYSLALSGGQVLSGLIIIGVIIYYQPRLGRLDRLDCIGMLVAGFGVVVWLASGNPLYGLLGSLAADSAATVMGIRASLIKGTADSLAFWGCWLLAGLAALLTAGSTHLVIVMAPLFSCLNALANMVVILYVRSRQPDNEELIAGKVGTA